jgi:hypothetical protein
MGSSPLTLLFYSILFYSILFFYVLVYFRIDVIVYEKEEKEF